MELSKRITAQQKRRHSFTLKACAEELPKKRIANVRGGKMTQYEAFRYKYDNLEEYIDSFKPSDLTYYFRETASESGYRYAINLHKDLAVFKSVLNNYSPREVCGMIEFLYKSEQDYLEKDRLSPNLLVSRWVNTIYADFQLWIDDKYAPKSRRVTIVKRDSKKGEYAVTDRKTNIGGKL